MLGLYIEGLLLGLVCALFVGPVLFTLLDASMQDGLGAGVRVALGIALSDVVAIALVIAGLGPVLTHPIGAQVLGILGGLILLTFGLALALRAHTVVAQPTARTIKWPFWAGFAVNFVNPFVFSFWVGAVGGVGARHGWTVDVMGVVFGGMVTTILVTDLLKAAAASALSTHLSGPWLVRARRLAGVLLSATGIGLLLRPLLQPALEM